MVGGECIVEKANFVGSVGGGVGLVAVEEGAKGGEACVDVRFG